MRVEPLFRFADNRAMIRVRQAGRLRQGILTFAIAIVLSACGNLAWPPFDPDPVTGRGTPLPSAQQNTVPSVER